MASPSPVFTGVCDRAGKVHLDAPGLFNAYVKTLAGKAIEVVCRRQVKHRTTLQVAYYFGVVIPEFAHHEGYRRDEHYHLHDGLMHKFWPLEPDKVTGAPRRRRLTLKEAGSEPPLDDEEMGIHLEQVVMFAAERGCIVPDADKGYRVNRERQERTAA